MIKKHKKLDFNDVFKFLSKVLNSIEMKIIYQKTVLEI